MKSNELRIGNLVELYGSIATIQRADFSGTGIAVDKGKPIKLKDDILKRLGFIESHAKLFYLPMPEISAEIHYEKQPYGNVITLQSNVGMFIPNDIDYVHQLQNLYFALTGEELKLKP